MHSFTRLLLAVDTSHEPARKVAERFGSAWATDWRIAIDDERIDVVVISTPNAYLCGMAIAALEAGKHVLIEKPMGRNYADAAAIANAARQAKGLLKVGFNHRYHPAIGRARELANDGAIGELIAIRARYGHGARPGYEKEWRAQAELAGGGELTDQGIHVIDLVRWFAGMPERAFAYTSTSVWPIAPLEDNAFALLRYPSGCTASVHVSWTQWKNLFSFEAFGKDGFVAVEGLGGSYGVETLVTGKRKPRGGEPDLTQEAFPGPDASWALEWDEFVRAIREGGAYSGNVEDGLAAMRIVAALYESARDSVPVLISPPT